MTEHEADDWNRFKLEIFGDVTQSLGDSDAFPQTLGGALALMRNVPQLIQNDNNGKGKPLTYVMLPVSYLSSQNLSRPTEPFGSVSEAYTIKVTHLFDNITEHRQKVHNKIDELQNLSNCVTSNELEKVCRIKDDLEVHKGEAKDELKQILETIRSTEEDTMCLDDFCDEHLKTSKDMSQECNKIYESVQARIEFTRRCERLGAEYLAPPVDQRIASACDDYDNVYVLFHGDADEEIRTRNESAFI